MNNYKYIIDPKNNKKYKITSKKGQDILRKQLKQSIKQNGGNELAYILGLGAGIPVGIFLLLLSGSYIYKQYRQYRMKFPKNNNNNKDDKNDNILKYKNVFKKKINCSDISSKCKIHNKKEHKIIRELHNIYKNTDGYEDDFWNTNKYLYEEKELQNILDKSNESGPELLNFKGRLFVKGSDDYVVWKRFKEWQDEIKNE